MVIGNNRKCIWICLVLLISIMGLVACQNKEEQEKKEDIETISSFLRYFESPQELKILTLEKYTSIDENRYYHMTWTSPEVENEVIDVMLEYKWGKTSMYHLFAFDEGYFAMEKKIWDDLKAQKPIKTYETTELEEILKKALDEKVNH